MKQTEGFQVNVTSYEQRDYVISLLQKLGLKQEDDELYEDAECCAIASYFRKSVYNTYFFGDNVPENYYAKEISIQELEEIVAKHEQDSEQEEKQTAETLAPLLWNAYKDVLNEEALVALRDVIENLDWDDINFKDDPSLSAAFWFDTTKQGKDFWWDVYDGKYNKQKENIVSEAVEESYGSIPRVVEGDKGVELDTSSLLRGWKEACEGIAEREVEKIDSHYSFFYKLSGDEVYKGIIKIDPYFIAQQWKLGQKDDTGVLFHCLKTIARFGDKNPVEREIKALHKQIVRLAELNNVVLEE